MYICGCVCVRVGGWVAYASLCVCLWVCVHVSLCAHVNDMSVCVHVSDVSVCACECVYIWVCVRMWVMWVCVRMWVCVHMSVCTCEWCECVCACGVKRLLLGLFEVPTEPGAHWFTEITWSERQRLLLASAYMGFGVQLLHSKLHGC